MEENKEIKEAVEELDEVSKDEELKRIAFLKEKYIRDEKSAQRYFREQGLQEGRAEAKEEDKKEYAKKMLEEKISLEVISRITGLSEEEIKKL